MDIRKRLQEEFKLRTNQVDNVLQLLDEGATIPFIARYRKEATGELDEVILRDFQDRYEYIKDIEGRKKTIVQTIDEQGSLTDELKLKIEECIEKSKLEDLYLPYKPKRKTRATTAKEKGLEPLIIWILGLTDPAADLSSEAMKYVNPEKGIENADEALKGASDIFAELVAERAENREFIRTKYIEKGIFVSKIRKSKEGEKTKYEMYYDYRMSVASIQSHNMLALRRAEKDGIILFDIELDYEVILNELYRREVKIMAGPVADFLKAATQDGFDRLMKASITAEARLIKKREADQESILNFEKNLRHLLLTSPAGHVPMLAIDPGFRTGCKMVALDKTGKFLAYQQIFPSMSQKKIDEAKEMLTKFINDYSPQFIAIGNGTASRETEKFVNGIVKEIDKKDRPKVLLVSGAGASVYSASKVALKEFPDLDVTVRGAISIGRRLMDPLAELVKIDPKSIGVGQYQHDVDQKLLKKRLGEVVELSVNYVGVDLNSASAELLSYVSGITSSMAENIIKRRDEKGLFKNRSELIEVAGLGKKFFQQAAGFLRIKGGDNPLDNSAVHPESYYIVENISAKIGRPIKEIIGKKDVIDRIDPNALLDDKTGMITINDILEELKKPGRDPRSTFKYAEFRDDVEKIEDLKIDMSLEGVVTNVTNFGAFVDIGVHQDGLVHISQMADRFVKNTTDVVAVGDHVTVRVMKVDIDLKRISLSMKKGN